jgi:FAD/FMN-containing dehydrogenase
MQELIEALTQRLGPDAVLTGADVTDRYLTDWSSVIGPRPAVVVRPDCTAQVSETMRACSQFGQPVVVQGGLTGLSGGAVPKAGELVLSLERMNRIEEVDTASMTLTAQAGTPLQKVQDAADASGFLFPLDLGARGSCNIGGNISTNAGGNQVLRFGMARNLVLGLEAVLADGTVISAMSKVLKNNSGYDLKQLFIGTEGTLGIVTRAVLRLFPKPKSCCTALVAAQSFADTIRLLQYLGSEFGGSLGKFEVMWASYFDFIITHVNTTRSPFDKQYPVYVLAEIDGASQDADQERFAEALAQAMAEGFVSDAAIAQSERERHSFWSIRDGVAEIGAHTKHSANFDVSVPISRMAEFLARVDRDLNAEFGKATALYFGHIGDNNLHLCAWTGNKSDTQRLYEIVYQATGEFGGSISAEHGIGVLKIPYLKHSRSEAELALMRRLKAALDPKGLLNPGRVVEC